MFWLCAGYDVFGRKVFVLDFRRQRGRLQPGEQEDQETRTRAGVFERTSVHTVLWSWYILLTYYINKTRVSIGIT